ncbi:MAG: uncharacterized protein JWM47_4169 [Acidimicrobiales bacterium]|nr:uncharacterized protein [Acidimicrobiales bacterium]
MKIEERNEGYMRVRTADTRNPSRIPRLSVNIKLSIESYFYESAFTVYDLADYDIILGKRWMQEINLRNEIDHRKNIMWIWDKSGSTIVHTLIGLAPNENNWGNRDTWVLEANKENIDLCLITENSQLEEGVWVYVTRVGAFTEGEKEVWEELGTVSEGMERILENNFTLFSGIDALPPPTRESFKIILKEGPTPNHRPWRSSVFKDEEILRQIKVGLDKGWVSPSTSEFASPVLFVPKKDGKLRMCIDY